LNPGTVGQDPFDTGVAHSARVYDYILGGRTNYAADREAGDAMCREWAALPVHMRANRRFMERASHYLAAEAGIRQFLDIGSGLPTSPNLHQVVQEVAADSRIVYIDNDPIVLAHARNLLTSTSQGRTAYVDADMHNPNRILTTAQFQGLLDLQEPVGLLIIGILHFILDTDDAHGLVQRLLDPLPTGSYLAMTIGTADFAPQEVARVAAEYKRQGMPMQLRTHEEALTFFDGLNLVAPGLTQVHHWRPNPGQEAVEDRAIAMYGAVARKTS
jgi:hypothetical protein